MKKLYLLFMILFCSFIMSACEKEDKTFTTTCDLTSGGVALNLEYDVYKETYIYNQEKVLEVLVNGGKVEKGLTVEVGSSVNALHATWDTYIGLGAECTDFYWE